jgi:mannosidase alpha-like ER degradation enhancer 2
VSLFETNIRVLGGLLSAHMLAVDFFSATVSRSAVFDYKGAVLQGPVPEPFKNDTGAMYNYDGALLKMATALADRLMPAYETSTGIPYGTVNLVAGVPKGETSIASLAGGGSLTLEFETLSRLTGNRAYGEAALKAAKTLWRKRSSMSLLGKHIDVQSGRWTESVSGIGSNSDSFYEYLLKYAVLFDSEEAWVMFADVYDAVKTHMSDGDWYADIDMTRGANGGGRRRFER